MTRSEHNQIRTLQEQLIEIAKQLDSKTEQEMFLFAPTLLGFQIRDVADKVIEDESVKPRWWVDGLNSKVDALWNEINSVRSFNLKLTGAEKEQISGYLDQLKSELDFIEVHEPDLKDYPF